MSKLVRENKQGFLGNELKTGFKALVLTKLKIQTTPKRLNPEELNNLMDKSCVAGLCGAVVAHMVLVAVFLFLGQHLRLEDSILARTAY